MDATATTTIGPRPPARIASWTHTAVLVGVFLGLALAAASLGVPSGRPAAAPLYLSVIVAECGLLFAVARGIRRSGTTLRDLLGRRWSGPRDVAADVGVAAAVWLVWTVVRAGLVAWLGEESATTVSSLLPRGALESALWIAVSIFAGIGEEVVFRGYLLRQFAAATGRRDVACVLQAVLFGVAHGYEGPAACVKITVYGLLLGVLALARRRLAPGILAHAWTDVAAGLLRI